MYHYVKRYCVAEYAVYREDEQAYSVGWAPYNHSIQTPENEYWIHQDTSSTKSSFTIGKTTVYSGGGYTVDLGEILMGLVTIFFKQEPLKSIYDIT